MTQKHCLILYDPNGEQQFAVISHFLPMFQTRTEISFISISCRFYQFIWYLHKPNLVEIKMQYAEKIKKSNKHQN